MDKHKANLLLTRLSGKNIEGYTIKELLNNGKSAAVFKAEKEGRFFAVKLFDNDLVERFGYEIQEKRIEQEIALKNHGIENLVKIYEGGSTTVDGINYYYLILEYIDGCNLKEFIQEREYDENFIRSVLGKLYSATEILLSEKNIVHRDIKPENIMIDSSGELVLMDLGVLKLVGAKSFSDEEEKQFVGTLRYAAPEFLQRAEEDTIKGWRALNLYQIGATIHDLIMKKELFSDKTPYSNLVIAIKDDIPRVTNTKYSFDLLQLTRDLLTKDDKQRLRICSDERIQKLINSPFEKDNDFEKGIEDILKIRVGTSAKFDEIEKLQKSKAEIILRQKETLKKLVELIESCFRSIESKGVFTKYSRSNNFRFNSDNNFDGLIFHNCLYELTGNLKIGFPKNLYILIRLHVNQKNYAEVGVLGIFPAIFGYSKPLEDPSKFFRDIFKQITPYNNDPTYSFDTLNIFEGVIEFDEVLQNYLSTKLVRLILASLKSVEPEVLEELNWQEHMAKSNQASYSKAVRSKTIFIDSI